jgi:hypothetical protein
MYKDFGKRLQRDIKKLVDSRLKMYETISQAGMKSEEQIKARNVDVNVISHKKQRYAVWFGGSLLADLVFFDIFNYFNSLISILIAIRKLNTKNMDQVLLDTTKYLDPSFNKFRKHLLNNTHGEIYIGHALSGTSKR